MVKFTSSLVIAALIAGPALAQANWDDLDTRDVSELELFGRELSDAEAAVFARELDELFTRHPEDADLASREIEDLAERHISQKVRNAFHKIGGFFKKAVSFIMRREDAADQLSARDYEEVDARDLDELFERYFEEIEERTPNMFTFMKEGMHHVKKVAQASGVAPPSSDVEERDFFDEQDVYERDLELNLDLSERDFEDELYERDFDEEDLLERDFEDELYEREFDEDDLLEREYYDDLD